jgi:polysaccharide biosynthesis protein PslF
MSLSFGVLSTFPPTQCGLATFSQALARHLHGSGVEVGIVRVVDALQPAVPLVAHQLVIGDSRALLAAAEALNQFDVAIVQHEYGIFGGRDGADVLDVLDNVRVPVVSVLHTVLTDPSPSQYRILARVIQASAVVVTMTETARQRLVRGWGVSPTKVVVIAHGAEDVRVPVQRLRPPSSTPTVLTWGLLGPGKGIEWAIQAMQSLTGLDPQPRYHVVGQTHPRVLGRDGEAYRDSLLASADRLGIAAMVDFDGRYLDGPSLHRIVADADVVLLPYDSRDQVTSGVLTEAVVAGKPVVSTAFPHAVELLSGGAGLLVPQRDSMAIAAALRRVLTEPGLADRMAATARVLAPRLLWPAVADEYVALADTLVASRVGRVA